ncbi:MAG: rod-binding protein [Pseudomonadota bacterium]
MSEVTALSSATAPTPATGRQETRAAVAAALSRFHASQTEAGAAAKAGDVATRFEAAFLAPLVTQILPPADSSVWGGGPGKLWRGLFAEEVASAIAQAGGVGIAPIIEKAMTAKQKVTP